MTRQEFIDNICDLDDLFSFCSEYDMYEIFDDRDIQSEDSFSEWIDEYYISDMIEAGHGWDDIRCALNHVSEIYNSYYWFDTSGYPEGVSSSGAVFDEMKQEALDWADERGTVFDDDNEDAEEEIEERYEAPVSQDIETQVKWQVITVEHNEPEPDVNELQDDMSLIMF